MKSSVTVTLIISGVLLILAPALIDLYTWQQLATVLAKHGDYTTLQIDGNPMSTPYRIFCWLMGTGMISIAVYFSFWASSRSDLRRERRTDQNPSMAREASYRDFMRNHPEFASAPNALRESAFKSWFQQPKPTV